MGASFSLSTAKNKVRRYEEEVQNFNGTYSSEQYKKLKARLSNTNKKILQLPINIQETQDCKAVILRVGKCFHDLKDKAHASTLQQLNSSNYLNISQSNERIVPPKREKAESNHRKKYPPLPPPSLPHSEASYTKNKTKNDKIRPPAPLPKASKGERSYTKHKAEYDQILSPIPKPSHSNIEASYTNIYPPLPVGDILADASSNEQPRTVLPPVPLNSSSNSNFDEIEDMYDVLIDNEQPRTILPPVPLNYDSNSKSDDIEVADDTVIRNHEDDAPKRVFPPVPLNSQPKIFPPIVKA